MGGPKIDFNTLEGNATSTFAGKDIADIVASAIPYLLALAGILFLVYIVYGGISLMLSQGDPKAIESSKAKITNGLIGFIVVFCAYWIVQLAGNILGLNDIVNTFKSPP